MTPISIDDLNARDAAERATANAESIGFLDAGRAAQGRSEGAIEPRVCLAPGLARRKTDLLRGAIAPREVALGRALLDPGRRTGRRLHVA